MSARNPLEKFSAILLGLCLKIVWNFLLNYFISHLSFEVVGLHLQEIDNALMLLLFSYRDLHAHRFLRQSIQN